MSAATALLALLEPGPAHGYTLKRLYDRRVAPAKPLPFGQVYASLARFERHGWADVAGVESGEGPERTLYRITEEGVSIVDEFVYTPQPPQETTSRTLLTRVSLALLSGRDTGQVLDAQRQLHLARMRELTEARRAADPEALLAITYELTHLDADVRWIDEAAQRMAAPTTGGTPR
jgi:DNA-binding PadR family transcriptional regulator